MQQNRASISRMNILFVVGIKAVIHFSIETEVEYISLLLTVVRDSRRFGQRRVAAACTTCVMSRMKSG